MGGKAGAGQFAAQDACGILPQHSKLKSQGMCLLDAE